MNYTVVYLSDAVDDVDLDTFYTSIEINLNKTLEESPIEGYPIDVKTTQRDNSDWQQQGTTSRFMRRKNL